MPTTCRSPRTRIRANSRPEAVVVGLVLAACFVSVSACATAPGPVVKSQRLLLKPPNPKPKSIADPGFLADFAKTYRFRLGQPRSLQITPDGKTVLFLRSGSRSFVQDLYALDVASGKERVVLSAESLLKGAAEHLSAEEKARRERMRQTARGLASYALSRDGKRLLVPLSGRLYVVNRATSKVVELATPKGKYALDPQLNRGGTHVSYVIDGDVYVYDISKGKERRLTALATKNVSYGSAEFVAQEEMRRRHGNWWSPDGKVLLIQRTDNTGVERLHTYDPAHPERASRGSAYPRPGKKNALVSLSLHGIRAGKPVPVKWDAVTHPYLVKVVWGRNGPLTICVQDRAQREILVLAVDRRSGKTTKLLTERDKAWLNIDPQMPRWLKSGGFLWTSERGGAWQLELRGKDGRLVRALTKPDFGYRKLAGLDAAAGKLWIVASKDPTQAHVWQIALGGKGALDGNVAAQQLTKAPGQHGLLWDKDSGVGVRTSNTVTGGSSWHVVGADGKPLAQIKSVAAKASFKPQVTFHTVGDKKYRAMLFKPRNFDPKFRYPVVVYVYGGPHWAVVNQSSSRLLMRQWIADHGYLVASFDGRGTPHRGRAWERAISGNFIAAPMADQVAALKALAKQVPQMDTRRVGIFGWSFGGYFSSMAVMRRPDVYKCAVAGAPVADWRDYDTHYTERYIGMPKTNKAGYDDSSVLTWAPKLSRPLLVIHGTADDNVYFAHAIKMSDAMFRAGVHHEFLPLTGFTHMVADPAVLKSLYGRILGHFGRCFGR